ncbi:2-isopropylmalate synthase [Lysinibacillus sphaericus]|uniref:2-isopropylmalate synthase n=2 Tax=Lysinibacillus TaxID=400634 RepID=W7RWY9_LYSSH|nr:MULTISPECIES: 2-isopropylmalate synthase [Lysinibacillus]MBE5085519.1 2-isopropylmalate synthase [Bacillus thuringiensis]AMO31834.1 2-isopropylmalate synthase [Lysinibacillus sphaericus]AMR89048.1 2-isopropylmalate synthase [Lysinibacillus sphaericus]ANA47119.1 2-isopropylmalate synthase [Lysinibacillus sphaericus]EWH31790.1 2-isopropylmalate synthase [Lysinibacillus sphaericus CBAM5]
MGRKIWVFDTTLRDGEQVPGAKLNLYEKVEIAQQLKKLGVDIIEAGFPASSQGDFDAVKAVAEKVGTTGDIMITALARAVKADIDAVYHAVKYAENPMIHMVLGTSDIHVEKKFSKSKDQILQIGVDAVKYAKTLLPQVQYSTEDASRSDFEYLWKTIEAVMRAGATMINVPDTVGFAEPEEFGEMIFKLNNRMKNLDDSVLLSVHCHNDLGMATANTLAAIKNGADKVECTINGIGERAGNAALEEVVMALKTRSTIYNADTRINTKEIINTSRLVSSFMGLDVQVNKAITGDNAFAHSSGIHQDGLLKSRDAYEIVHPEDVGLDDMELVLTARSGRHAVKNALEKLGFSNLSTDEFEGIFEGFLKLADAKKEVYDHDLYVIVESYYEKHDASHKNATHYSDQFFDIEDLQVVSNTSFPSASVKVRKGNEVLKASAVGSGPIDALYSAIAEITSMDVKLVEYNINSVSRGKEALGKVKITIEHEGEKYMAKAADTDILKASALAYMNAINSIVVAKLTPVMN